MFSEENRRTPRCFNRFVIKVKVRDGQVGAVWWVGFYVDGESLPSSTMTLIPPSAKGKVLLRYFWPYTTSATYTAKMCLSMLMGSFFMPKGIEKTVSTSSHVQMVSSITILQLMVHRCCISWADRNVCRPSVGQCTGVWRSNTLLQSFVSQEYDPEPDSDTRARMLTHSHIHACVHTNTYTYITQVHTHIHATYIHTQIYTHTHPCMRTYKHITYITST